MSGEPDERESLEIRAMGERRLCPDCMEGLTQDVVDHEPVTEHCGRCGGTGWLDVDNLSPALDAFIAAYGEGCTWAEVLPLVALASGLERDYERCVRCEGRGDLFNGGWKRKPCEACGCTGRGSFRGWRLAALPVPVEEPTDD